MIKRTITGAIILIFTVLFLVLKQYNPLIFDAYILIIMYGALFEVLRARKFSGTMACEIPLLLTPAALCMIFAWDKLQSKAFLYVLLLVVAILFYTLIVDLIRLAQNRKSVSGDKNVNVVTSKLFNLTKHTMMTFAYPILPISLLFAINHFANYDLSYIALIMCFAVSMLTDTCAFLFGIGFGKHKLAPEISPKKTVEGMIGGFVGGIVAALGCFFLFYYTNIFDLAGAESLPVIVTLFIVMGIFGSFFNQMGDLVESAYKRKLNVKDFSNIFPGHGGFMDRVDGFLLTSSFIYIIFTLFLV